MSENRPPAAESLKSILADLRRENLPIRKAPPRDQWVKRTKRLERLMILASFDQHGLVAIETGKRKWAQLWDDVDVLLPELVSLAKVPPTGYRGFCLAVHERMLEFIDRNWSADRDDKAVLRAEKLLRAAQDAVLALSESQRRLITRAMLSCLFEQHDDWTHQLPKMPAGIFPEPDDWTHAIPKVLDGIAMITGSAPYRANEPTKRGPKRKRSHLLEFRRFGKDLWRIARHHGGDFKVWVDPKDDPKKDDARGSMAEALRLLEPVLPPELVPKIISAKMLNLLKP